jgi:hypothetical protein
MADEVRFTHKGRQRVPYDPLLEFDVRPIFWQVIDSAIPYSDEDTAAHSW